MSDWTYKIPDTWSAPQRMYKDGRLQHQHSYRVDLESPRVGLFCEEKYHAGEPWLLGSFVPDSVHLERGEFKWAFELRYPTGDGYVITLAGAEVQLLNDDERVNIGKDDPVRVYDSSTRGRWPFKCGACDLDFKYRVETFQTPVTTLWRGGCREISLSGLNSAIKRARS